MDNNSTQNEHPDIIHEFKIFWGKLSHHQQLNLLSLAILALAIPIGLSAARNLQFLGASAASPLELSVDKAISATRVAVRQTTCNGVCDPYDYVPCPAGTQCIWAGYCPSDCPDQANPKTPIPSVKPLPSISIIPIQPIDKGGNPCIVSGCNGELCVNKNSGDGNSTCVYKEHFACFRNAECKLQASGQCGWTQTPELQQCLGSQGIPSPAPSRAVTPTPIPQPGSASCGNNICEPGEATMSECPSCKPGEICSLRPCQLTQGSCPQDCLQFNQVKEAVSQVVSTVVKNRCDIECPQGESLNLADCSCQPGTTNQPYTVQLNDQQKQEVRQVVETTRDAVQEAVSQVCDLACTDGQILDIAHCSCIDKPTFRKATASPTAQAIPEQDVCEASNGRWQTFSNTCVDNCNVLTDPLVACGEAETQGCECGANRCWNGKRCVGNPHPLRNDELSKYGFKFSDILARFLQLFITK